MDQLLYNRNALKKIKSVVNNEKHICCKFTLMIAYQTFFFRHFVTLNFILHVLYIFIDSIDLVDACMWSSINITENRKFSSLDSTTCHMKDQHALTLPSTKTFKNCSARVKKMIRQIPWNYENLWWPNFRGIHKKLFPQEFKSYWYKYNSERFIVLTETKNRIGCIHEITPP